MVRTTARAVRVAVAGLMTVVVAGAAAPVAAAPPTAAGPAADVAAAVPYRPLTTADGKVIPGVRFVADGDVLQVKQAQVLARGPAVAAAPVWYCSGWRFISHGAPNSRWKPGQNDFIFANGNGGEPWFEQLAPCWISGWETHAWAFLSNRTGMFVSYGSTHLRANKPPSADAGDHLFSTKWFACYYDGNWQFLRVPWTSSTRAFRDPTTAGVFTDSGSLNGNHLLKIEPPVYWSNC